MRQNKGNGKLWNWELEGGNMHNASKANRKK